MEWLKISTSSELVRVRTDEIAYVQADGNYSDLWLFNGKCHKMTFKLHFFDETFQQLHNNMFVRVGRSLIVNKRYIYIINLIDKKLVLSGQNLRGDFTLSASKESLTELKGIMEHEKGGNEDDK